MSPVVERSTRLPSSVFSLLRSLQERRLPFSVCLHSPVLSTPLTSILGSDGDDALRRTQQGFDMVSIITDVGVFGDGMLRELEKAKGTAKVEGKRDGY